MGRLITFAIAAALIAPSAMAETLTARGVVKSLAEATISVDYTARITQLPVLEGDSFLQGDVLISFDCKRFNAEIAAAKANAHAQELTYSNNKRLLARGAIGANEVKISQAQYEKARAEAVAAQARTGNCDYRAPFDGKMVERIAQEHESPAASQPLIKIVDTTRLEAEAIVPSQWLKWMKQGQGVSFLIDETGDTANGEVIRVGAAVDPVSQTVKVYLDLSKSDSAILPGMSGTATFARPGS
jgi:membrane fusion protein, multidrug efflux system